MGVFDSLYGENTSSYSGESGLYDTMYGRRLPPKPAAENEYLAPSELSKGLRRGVLGTGAVLNQAAGQALEPFAPETAKGYFNRAAGLSNEAQAPSLTPRTAKFKEINGVESFGDWAASTFGEGVISTMPSIAGGLIGLATRNPKLGFGLGAAAMGAQETGSASMEMHADPGIMRNTTPGGRLAASLGYGAAAGIAEQAVPSLLLSKAGRAAVSGNALKQLPRHVGLGMAGEYATESAQDLLQQGVMKGLNPQREIDLEQTFLEAGPAGAIVGGGIGGITGGVAAAQQALGDTVTKVVDKTRTAREASVDKAFDFILNPESHGEAAGEMTLKAAAKAANAASEARDYAGEKFKVTEAAVAQRLNSAIKEFNDVVDTRPNLSNEDKLRLRTLFTKAELDSVNAYKALRNLTSALAYGDKDKIAHSSGQLAAAVTSNKTAAEAASILGKFAKGFSRSVTKAKASVDRPMTEELATFDEVFPELAKLPEAVKRVAIVAATQPSLMRHPARAQAAELLSKTTGVPFEEMAAKFLEASTGALRKTNANKLHREAKAATTMSVPDRSDGNSFDYNDDGEKVLRDKGFTETDHDPRMDLPSVPAIQNMQAQLESNDPDFDFEVDVRDESGTLTPAQIAKLFKAGRFVKTDHENKVKSHTVYDQEYPAATRGRGLVMKMNSVSVANTVANPNYNLRDAQQISFKEGALPRVTKAKRFVEFMGTLASEGFVVTPEDAAKIGVHLEEPITLSVKTPDDIGSLVIERDTKDNRYRLKEVTGGARDYIAAAKRHINEVIEQLDRAKTVAEFESAMTGVKSKNRNTVQELALGFTEIRTIQEHIENSDNPKAKARKNDPAFMPTFRGIVKTELQNHIEFIEGKAELRSLPHMVRAELFAMASLPDSVDMLRRLANEDTRADALEELGLDGLESTETEEFDEFLKEAIHAADHAELYSYLHGTMPEAGEDALGNKWANQEDKAPRDALKGDPRVAAGNMSNNPVVSKRKVTTKLTEEQRVALGRKTNTVTQTVTSRGNETVTPSKQLLETTDENAPQPRPTNDEVYRADVMAKWQARARKRLQSVAVPWQTKLFAEMDAAGEVDAETLKNIQHAYAKRAKKDGVQAKRDADIAHYNYLLDVADRTRQLLLFGKNKSKLHDGFEPMPAAEFAALVGEDERRAALEYLTHWTQRYHDMEQEPVNEVELEPALAQQLGRKADVPHEPIVYSAEDSAHLYDVLAAIADENPDAMAGIKSLNNEQQAAALAPLDRSTMVIAGAGSGKTKTFVSRFHIASRAFGEKKVRAMTFTKDAAQEMAFRMFGAEIAEKFNLSEEGDIKTLIKQAWKNESPIAKANHYIAGIKRRVGTLDSLTYNLVKDGNWHLDPSEHLLGPDGETIAYDKDGGLPVTMGQDHPLSHSVLKHMMYLSSALDLPVVQSAKTFHRQLQEGLISHANDLLGTYEGVLEAAWEKETKKKDDGTFKAALGAIAAGISSKSLNGKLTTLEQLLWSQAKPYDNKTQVSWALFNADFAKEMFKAPDPAENHVGGVMEYIDSKIAAGAKAELQSDGVLGDIYFHVQKSKMEDGLITYGDYTAMTLRRLQSNKEDRAAGNAKWQYIMVDEFQDTSAAQLGVIDLLVHREDGTKAAELFAVGDDDQSIYGFRGARVQNIDDAQRIMDMDLLRMPTNYRSTKTIVNAANELIKNNGDARMGKTLKASDMNNVGEPIEILSGYSQEDEGALIINRVQALLKKGVKREDIAILYGRKSAFNMAIPGEVRSKLTGVVRDTIHNAKGLEWDYVFVIDVTEGGLPRSKSLRAAGGDPEHAIIKEERNLMYVALTRAKKQAFVTFSEKTYPVPGPDGEEITLGGRSRFITELEGHTTYPESDPQASVKDIEPDSTLQAIREKKQVTLAQTGMPRAQSTKPEVAKPTAAKSKSVVAAKRPEPVVEEEKRDVLSVEDVAKPGVDILQRRKDNGTFVYTNDQKVALAGLDKFISDKAPQTKWALIDGSAGTGKTTIVENLVNAATAERRAVYVVAPTNKALSVLRVKLANIGDGLEYRTLFGALYVPETNARGGLVAARGESARIIPENTNALIIVDEASMVNAKDLKELDTRMRGGARIVMLGDNNQVPPVGKESSNPKIFDPDSSAKKFDARYKFTEVRRQELDSAILMYATGLARTTSAFILEDSDSSELVVEPIAQLKQRAIDAMAKASGNSVILVMTNPDRVFYNNAVREKLGYEAGTLKPGEPIIGVANKGGLVNGEHVLAPADLKYVATYSYVADGKKGAAVLYSSGDKLFLLYPDLQGPSSPYNAKYKFVSGDQGTPLIARSFETSDQVMGNIALATYGYAMTVHKSQGSQWDTVYFAPTKMLPDSNGSTRNLIYTAITRAAKQLYMPTSIGGVRTKPVAAVREFVLGKKAAPEAKSKSVVTAKREAAVTEDVVTAMLAAVEGVPAQHRPKELAKLQQDPKYVLAPRGGYEGYAAKLGKIAAGAGLDLQSNLDKVQPGDLILVSVPGAGRDFPHTPALIELAKQALDDGAILITDNRAHATRTHNMPGEGALRQALLGGGYVEESGEHFSKWKAAPGAKGRPSVVTAEQKQAQHAEELLKRANAILRGDEKVDIPLTKKGNATIPQRATLEQKFDIAVKAAGTMPLGKLTKTLKAALKEAASVVPGIHDVIKDTRKRLKLDEEGVEDTTPPIQIPSTYTEAQKKFVDTVRKMLGDRAAVLFDQRLGNKSAVAEFNSQKDALDEVREARRQALAKGDKKQAAIYEEQEAAILADTAVLGTIKLAVGTMPIDSLAWHETLHAAFSTLLTPEERRVVVTAFNQGFVLARLKKHFAGQPEVLAAIDKSKEEAAAYGFQLWMKDEALLAPGDALKGVFNKMLAFLKKVLNILTPSEKATIILRHLAAGHRALPGAASPLKKTLFKDLSLAERTQETLKTVGGVIKTGYDALFDGVYNRLIDFENPAIAKAAELGYQQTGESGAEGGMIQRQMYYLKFVVNKIDKAFEGLDEDQLQALNKAAILGKEPTDPALAEPYARIRSFLDHMHDYQTRAGIPLGDKGRGSNYFPLNWDAEVVLKDQEAFYAMLLKPEYKEHMASLKMSPSEIWEGITGYLERGELLVDVMGEHGSPLAESTRRRSLDFISREDRLPFMSTDVKHTLVKYSKQAVRQAEFVRSYGVEGEILEQLKTEAKEKYGADINQMELLNDYINGLMGNKEIGMSRELKDMYGAIITYQNYRLLPFSLMSSLVDPIGIAIRSGSLVDAWNTFTYSMAGLFKQWKKDYPRDFFEDLAEDWGIIERHGLTINAHNMYEGITMRGTTKSLNEGLFKYNLLNGWIKNNTIMAVMAAQRSMWRAAEGKMGDKGDRYLEELGIDKADIMYDENLDRIMVRAAEFESRGVSAGEAIRKEAAVRNATEKFVRQALLAPNAAMMPNWGSNPYMLPIFHLKQFVFAFNETITKRIFNEMGHGNYTPALIALSYVPGMIVADFLKDMISNMGDEPEYKKNWGLVDYMQHGITRSGLTGVGAFLADAKEDSLRGGIGLESLSGPTLGQANKAIRALNSNDPDSLWNFAVKSGPIMPVYDQWLLQ